MRGLRLSAAVLVVSSLALGAVGCAYRQTKLDTIAELDRRRFDSCRGELQPHLCDGGDCASWAVRLYLAQSPPSRRQWLLDYGCHEETLRGAEQ